MDLLTVISMRCSAYDRRWATTRYQELIRITDMILWFWRRYCKVVQIKPINEAIAYDILFALFRFIYLIWQMSGWDFMTVSWQLPVPSYASGWLGFTKYVPLSRAIPPQDAITARRFFKSNYSKYALKELLSLTNTAHSITFGTWTTSDSATSHAFVIRNAASVLARRCLAQWLTPLNHREQR